MNMFDHQIYSKEADEDPQYARSTASHDIVLKPESKEIHSGTDFSRVAHGCVEDCFRVILKDTRGLRGLFNASRGYEGAMRAK